MSWACWPSNSSSRRPEAVHSKALHQLTHEQQQQRIDHLDKEPQRGDEKRQGQHQQQRTHEGVEESEQQRRHQDRQGRVIVDARDDLCRHKHPKGGDHPALQEGKEPLGHFGGTLTQTPARGES